MRKTGNGSFSFMDLLFGTLGAVVLLLIITLSLSGPPEKIRDRAQRTIEWKIVADKGGIAKVSILIYGQEIMEADVGETLLSKTINFFTLTTEGKTLGNGLSEYSMAVTCDTDEDFDMLSNMSLRFGNDYVPFRVNSANVSISPGEGEKASRKISDDEVPTDKRIFYTLAIEMGLYDKEGGGKMPEIRNFEIQ